MGCSASSSARRHRGSNGHRPDSAGQLADTKTDSGADAMLTAEEVMSVLLVTSRQDQQLTSCVSKASSMAGVNFEVARGSESAMSMYIGGRHDLVCIDRRTGAEAADSLLRSLRSVSQSEFSTFVAVTKAGNSPSNLSLKELLLLGYDMKFANAAAAAGGNGNGGYEACCDLLLTCQRNCSRHQQRLSAMSAVFTALDHVGDAVEITDDKFCIQYVNAAYERMFGLGLSEVAGRSSFEAAKVEKTEEELSCIQQMLRKGREWDGTLSGRRKSGAAADHYSSMFPVRGRRGKVQHFVSVKQPLTSEKPSSGAVSHRDSAVSRDSFAFINAFKAGRKDSDGNRTNSMTIEAPIHRVISLISAAQEAGTPPATAVAAAAASAALDKAMDILQHTPDLYASELCGSAVEDKLASDYVEGLMTNHSRPADKKRFSLQPLRTSAASVMRSLSEVPEDVAALLENDDDWSFDIIELERVTDKKPMVYVAMKILRRFNVCQLLRCSDDTLLRWLQVVQHRYRSSNSYHNATHGADVMQCSAYFLERARVKAVFDEMDEAASLLGALVHDIDHPGRTNPFLINSQHRLALLYNDISVLESHHASLAFQLTANDSSLNIFKHLSRDEYRQLRQDIIDTVLATEMAKHFEHVTKFSNQIVAPLSSSAAAAAEAVGASPGDDGGDRRGEVCDDDTDALEALNKPENRMLIKRVLIKCADISNQCRPLALCREWSRRISEEYFQQTDEEKLRSLPIVMPVFDRASCNLAQTQISFIDFFLRDMLMAWHAFCDVPLLVENMNNNYAYWRQVAEEGRPAASGANAGCS